MSEQALLMNIMSFIVVVASSIWAYTDAQGLQQRAQAQGPRRKEANVGGQSPATRLAGCLLLWIVCFPWYLIARQRMIHELEIGRTPQSSPPPPPPSKVERYVATMRGRGVADREIAMRLIQKGWRREQISRLLATPRPED